MIRKLIRAYADNKGHKIRLTVTTWVENESAEMGLENVGDITEWLTVKQAEALITELKNAVYDYYEGDN
jgi:hypothetical protein